jgi:uncharacterized membrane protein
MKDKNLENTNIPQSTELELDGNAQRYLKKVANWAFFWAVMGFIVVAILILYSLMQVINSKYDATLFFTIILVVLIGIPVLYLHNFAKKAKKALKSQDENESSNLIEESMKYLFFFYSTLAVVIFIAMLLLPYFIMLIIPDTNQYSF